jgi:hypothetical protein
MPGLIRHPVALNLHDTLALASRDGRLCPKPGAWARLYALLPQTRRDAYGAIPPEPLTADTFAAASDDDKRHRFIEHLQWANDHHALAEVHAFLSALAESEWHHVGD